MTSEKRKFSIKKEHIFHVVSVALILASLCFSVFRFENVAVRTWQALKDFGSSALYYVQQFGDAFGLCDVTVTPTVTEIPGNMTALIPVNWTEFKAYAIRFANLLINWAHVKSFFSGILDILSYIGWWVVLLITPLLICIGCIYLMYAKVDNEHGKDSLPRKIWFKIEDILIFPVWGFIRAYIDWLKEGAGEKYLKALKTVWFYNLNFMTIALEVVAFYLYVGISFDFLNIFAQLAKLAIDLSVALTFVPIPVLVLIGLKIFDKWRKNKGYEKLEANEEENKQFLRDHPENILATGEPRAGKTQGITDMTISQDAIFREEAKAASFKRRMQFPHFPWVNLEQTLLRMRKSVPDFDLSFIRTFIHDVKVMWSARAMLPLERQACMFVFYRGFGYIGAKAGGFPFGYNYKKYGTEYDNNLQIIDIFECIEKYAEEFYIYTNPTPMNVGNYPIRFQYFWEDYGNTPILNVDLFRKSPREIMEAAEWNHRFYYDMARLGKKKDPNGPYVNNFEIGSETIAEIGKERGNQNARIGIKKDSDECNAANDLFEMDAKMRSHGTTIDYFTYFRIFADEQRAMELLASLREIGSKVNFSRKNQKMKNLMPGFAFEELLYQSATEIMKKILEFMDKRHGLQTLFMYFVNCLYAPIYDHYWRIFNTFSSYDVELKIVNLATDDAEQQEKNAVKYKYHISTKKVRSGVYDTGYFGTFYREKFKKSKTGGINQIPQWSGKTPRVWEFRSIGSHNYDEVFSHMNEA